MTLSMADFDSRYGELFNNAHLMNEPDKGLKVAKNLFLLEDMEPDVRLAVATMAKVYTGMKLKAVLLEDEELNRTMALSKEEQDQVATMLGKLSEQMKNG